MYKSLEGRRDIVMLEQKRVQTVAIILEAHNFLEYHYML